MSLIPPVVNLDDLYQILIDVIRKELETFLKEQDSYILERAEEIVGNITQFFLDDIKEGIREELLPLGISLGVVSIGLWGILFGMLIKINKKLSKEERNEDEEKELEIK